MVITPFEEDDTEGSSERPHFGKEEVHQAKGSKKEEKKENAKKEISNKASYHLSSLPGDMIRVILGLLDPVTTPANVRDLWFLYECFPAGCASERTTNPLSLQKSLARLGQTCRHFYHLRWVNAP